MKRVLGFFERGNIAPLTLIASAFIGLMIIMGFIAAPSEKEVVDMRIEPALHRIAKEGTFTVEVVVESSVPANVFSGELNFNPEVLAIESIDYNTSIADLWAEEPWYSNGDGTLNFAGGTTRPGGFQGTDTLIKATFKTLQEGEGTIALKDARILLHDGLGTDAQLQSPIDAIITIGGDETPDQNLIAETDTNTTYEVVEERPSTDLNGDGKQSIADISIFMINLAGNDVRYDFNLDGEVNIKDLNILLGAG